MKGYILVEGTTRDYIDELAKTGDTPEQYDFITVDFGDVTEEKFKDIIKDGKIEFKDFKRILNAVVVDVRDIKEFDSKLVDRINNHLDSPNLRG